MLISNTFKKFFKNVPKKVLAKTWRKYALFPLLLMYVKLVLLLTFLLHFSKKFLRIWNQHEILRFLYLFWFKKKIYVIVALFSNFEAKRAKNGAKNQKTYKVQYMCLKFNFFNFLLKSQLLCTVLQVSLLIFPYFLSNICIFPFAGILGFLANYSRVPWYYF
jgi:hypothetical protein